MSAPRLLAPTTISGGVPTAGAGTLNTIALWTPDGSTLGNSLLTQSGNIVTNASGAIRAAGTTQTSPAFTRHDTTTSGIYFPATNEIGFTISNQHAMFISSGRLVGIGTVSPGARLHCVGADGSYQFAVSGTTKGIRFLTTASVAQIDAVDQTLSASYQPLFLNGSTVTLAYSGGAALTVNASGNVGIGTVTPGAKLHVNGATWVTGGSLYCDTLVPYTGGATPMSIASLIYARTDTNSVGIGTASPIAGGLTVYGASNGQVFVQNSSGYTRLLQNGTDFYIDGNVSGSAGNIIFRRASSTLESARFDSSGRLLVGTSTAPATTGARAAFAHNANLYLSLNNTTSNTGVLIGVEGTKGIFYTSTGAIGSESYVIASTYDTTGIQLGTTAAMVFNASGTQQGLKLPATPGNTDAQTLDCYQDGGSSAGGLSWTPTLSAAATWGGTAPTVLNARYTRIGNIVFCTVTLDPTGGVAFSATYGTSTITAPPGLSATTSTVVPSNRGGVSANGAQGANTVYIPTYASSTNSINVSWFFAV